MPRNSTNHLIPLIVIFLFMEVIFNNFFIFSSFLGFVYACNLIFFSLSTPYPFFVAILCTRSFCGIERQVQRRGKRRVLTSRLSESAATFVRLPVYLRFQAIFERRKQLSHLKLKILCQGFLRSHFPEQEEHLRLSSLEEDLQLGLYK